MAYKNLEEAVQASGNIVKMMRNSQIGAYVYPVVPPSSRIGATSSAPGANTCVLFDQSHHMVNLYVEGPDAAQAGSRISAIN